MADLTPQEGTTSDPILGITMYKPLWDVRALNSPLVEVYCDPYSGGPIVVRTSRGMLWSSRRAAPQQRRHHQH